MDVTKLKSRTFTQSAKVAQSTKSSGPNLWTETPAERQQRMNDELLGIKSKAEVSAGGGGRQDEEEEGDDKRRKRERDWALREEVDRHNVRLLSSLDRRVCTDGRRFDRNLRGIRRCSIHIRGRRRPMGTTRTRRQGSGTGTATCRSGDA